jgi:amidase
MQRRLILQGAAALPALATFPARPADGGSPTIRARVQSLNDRADAIDQAGPGLNAIIERNPLAPAIASAMDQARLQGDLRGPLHGVPVLLKDNIDTGDGLRTSAGSLALADTPAAQDAALVSRLRQAGLVVLGKTNLSEWANFRGQGSISGWSARGGQTRNPHALDRSPSGSSSGSAAAVAAGLAPLAVGTETDGSIVTPASMCGVVGIKPTVGLVSQQGLVPIAHSMDTAGPLATTVADAARLLQAMADVDAVDPAARRAARALAALDMTRLDRGALRGARLGVATEYFGLHAGADRLADAALQALRDAGAELIDLPQLVSDTPALGAAEFEVLLYEFKHGLNRYLAARGDTAGVSSLSELIAFNRRHADRELKWFGQETLIAAQARGRSASRRTARRCRPAGAWRAPKASMRHCGATAWTRWWRPPPGRPT